MIIITNKFMIIITNKLLIQIYRNIDNNYSKTVHGLREK